MNIILPTLREERRKTLSIFTDLSKNRYSIGNPLLEIDKKNGKAIFDNKGKLQMSILDEIVNYSGKLIGR